MKKDLSVAHAFCFSDAAYSQRAINKDVSKANLYTTSENSYIGKVFFILLFRSCMGIYPRI
ncbi:hypothetical protein [uncultured Chryseobacterium sp.]|uniref:hypothetical protein n=1 Tax=uncultured Chryseobacterium sp. TaxID=259322 RepID=UPI0025D3F875|nr:hypothetical protein [uncultured Chryseobacterium sp.]